MNRADLRQLAHIRVAEARALRAAGHAAGAYYLAGYAVECALKACIAKAVQQYDFPERDRVNQSYSHNLAQLLRIAGLEASLDAATNQNHVLARYWAIVKDWNQSWRYSLSIVAKDADALLAAVDDPANGVLRWLASHW